MRRLAFPVTLLLVLTVPSLSQPARGNPEVAFGGQSVDAMIASFMKEHGVAGMSLAIVQAPYITRATGYGVADPESRTLVGANTLFDIGQMRDAFTAVAVMQLVESGRLPLEDVRDKLADAKRYAELEGDVERASGTTWEAFVRAGQIERAGLRHTYFASDLPGIAREAVGPDAKHRRFLQAAALIDPTEPATGQRDAARVPPGRRAIYSSAYDISVWDIALAGEVLVKDAALRKLLYSAVADDGSRRARAGAWSFPGHDGLMVATGSRDGFSSLLSRFTHPDELVCVTLLANKEGLDLTQLARRIAGAFNARLGPPAGAAGKRVQQSPRSLDETRARIAALPQPSGVEAWEESGEVWVSAADPGDVARRNAVDRMLLEIVE